MESEWKLNSDASFFQNNKNGFGLLSSLKLKFKAKILPQKAKEVKFWNLSKQNLFFKIILTNKTWFQWLIVSSK